MRLSNIKEISSGESGYDVVIVCTSNENQCKYWQARLEHGKGSVIPTTCKVIAVHEDWPGGAGNGLGTLYAYQKALAVDSSVAEGLARGELSVALFHTAGKGTRLAPLPGGENNNKPGVKLPCSKNLADGTSPTTILESVIRQTGAYASSRKGRLSVFW